MEGAGRQVVPVARCIDLCQCKCRPFPQADSAAGSGKTGIMHRLRALKCILNMVESYVSGTARDACATLCCWSRLAGLAKQAQTGCGGVDHTCKGGHRWHVVAKWHDNAWCAHTQYRTLVLRAKRLAEADPLNPCNYGTARHVPVNAFHTACGVLCGLFAPN